MNFAGHIQSAKGHQVLVSYSRRRKVASAPSISDLVKKIDDKPALAPKVSPARAAAEKIFNDMRVEKMDDSKSNHEKRELDLSTNQIQDDSQSELNNSTNTKLAEFVMEIVDSLAKMQSQLSEHMETINIQNEMIARQNEMIARQTELMASLLQTQAKNQAGSIPAAADNTTEIALSQAVLALSAVVTASHGGGVSPAPHVVAVSAPTAPHPTAPAAVVKKPGRAPSSAKSKVPADADAGQKINPVEIAAVASSAAPIKRKRGRPRIHPLPPAKSTG